MHDLDPFHLFVGQLQNPVTPVGARAEEPGVAGGAGGAVPGTAPAPGCEPGRVGGTEAGESWPMGTVLNQGGRFATVCEKIGDPL